MANNVVLSFKDLGKTLSIFEQTKAKFAGKVALTKFGRELKQRIIPKTYKLKFKNPVTFTTNSTFTQQNGLILEVGVKDESAMKKRGNPASKYLFPVIGRGSNLVYETLFSQHLIRSNFMEDGQYPYAVLGNKFIKRKASNGRVTNTVLQNTLIGLGKTRDGEISYKARGSGKIQDARVIAFKKDTGKFKAGIYRQMAKGRGKKTSVFLAPLFMYGDLPTVPKRGFFDDFVTDPARKRLPELWLQQIKQFAKENR
tara:strand:- start:1173 stop:1937 length:765 start_codon:yes stop_codon:yes gene_type:complete